MTDLYVRSYNPIWDFRSLTGLPLDDTSWAYFLSNTFPYIPQNVYHSASGTVWNSPVQLSAAGTLQDIFFDPTLVYRIEIRTNEGNLTSPTQSDPLVWLIENYVPSGEITPPITSANLSSSNQITNPQFAVVNFSSPKTLTGISSGTIPVGPGWDLVVEGSGDVTLTQHPNNAEIDTNAPYILEVQLSGWTSAYLVQRFNQDGMLWANKNVTSSITARIEGASEDIIGQLKDNDDNLVATLYTQSLTSEYKEYRFNVLLGPSANTTEPPDAYVEYRINLPPDGDVFLTSVQVLATNTNVRLSYEQDTTDRQIDHTFHNYKDSILVQEKESILTGWDFPLNPWQFRSTSMSNLASTGDYTADQTIVITEDADSVKVGRGTDPLGAFQIASIIGQPQGRIAIIQYIDPKTCARQWNEILSALAEIKITTSEGTVVGVKARLIYSSTLPSPSNPVASWDADGPVFVGQWTALKPLNGKTSGFPISNDPEYILTDEFQDLAFDGFVLPNMTGSSATLGIVLFTTSELSTLGIDTIAIKCVSLTQNSVAIKATTLTYDETLRRCQFYYEKSYRDGVLPGAITYNNVYSPYTNEATQVLPFALKYKTVKRANPIITFYNPQTGVINEFIVLETDFTGAIVNTYTFPQGNMALLAGDTVGIDSTNYFATSVMVIGLALETTMFHYTIDSRL